MVSGFLVLYCMLAILGVTMFCTVLKNKRSLDKLKMLLYVLAHISYIIASIKNKCTIFVLYRIYYSRWTPYDVFYILFINLDILYYNYDCIIKFKLNLKYIIFK